jgi:hypothetical protein
MSRGESVTWSPTRTHECSDGTSLQLQVEKRHARVALTRAAVLDALGNELDATEWVADPAVRVLGPLPRLRALVDERLATDGTASAP